MAKKCIILLLDGTWNDAEAGVHDTNIVRMRQIIARSLDSSLAPAAAQENKMAAGRTFRGGDVEHIVLYERGVGTGLFDQVRGGAFGRGLDNNIRRAYKFLCRYYEPGDQIFVFGFSRGAYTARSLVGLIGAAGLLKRENCTAERENLAWSYYRTPPNDRLPGVAEQLEPAVHDWKKFKIDCVGVFDTVGALGVPLKTFWRLNRQRYEFHNVELSSIVKVNLHALALDEHRYPFRAAVWRKPKFISFKSHTEQVWFPGAHADVGGSYVAETLRCTEHRTALDDITLDWMLRRVTHYYGDFPFDRAKAWKPIDQSWAEARGHEARRRIYRFWPVAQRMPANIEAQPRRRRRERTVCYERHEEPIAEMVHISALLRLGQRVPLGRRKPAYEPWNLVTVLKAIQATYGAAAGAARTAPDILIVDWTGAPLKADCPRDRAAAMQLLRSARMRLGLEPTRDEQVGPQPLSAAQTT